MLAYKIAMVFFPILQLFSRTAVNVTQPFTLLTLKPYLNMQSKTAKSSVTLNDLHFMLASMADIFYTSICEACNWSAADYHFHLKNPGHMTADERKKVNSILHNLLMITYAKAPKLPVRRKL